MIKNISHLVVVTFQTMQDVIPKMSKETFASKILVWLVLSSKGISQPFIVKTGGPAITKEVYIKKSLPKLVTFIENYHTDDKVSFWPDLASSHYAKMMQVSSLHNAHNIPLVPKEVNPPNIPKAWLIEDFWGILASMVYKEDWKAKTDDQLACCIKKR